MKLFITVHDRVQDKDIELNMSSVESYKEALITDLDETQHICILYIINNGLRIEEEFDSVSARSSRIEELNEYLIS